MMLTLVIVLNVLLALLCLGVAWQVWKLRRVLSRVANTLSAAEQRTHSVLHGAPRSILKGQTGSQALRLRYQQLEQQLQQVQQILDLCRWGMALVRRSGNRQRSRR
jgi:uncharacterized protein YoxC